MGLDQYLNARRSTNNASWTAEEDRKLFASLVEITNTKEFLNTDFPSVAIEISVAYWRKANAIHSWFVENCQDGVDECQEVWVERHKLEELRDVCRRVLANHALASEHLPTCTGFFFGTTDYDSWYFENLEYTAETIDKILSLPEQWSFYYQSSW